MQLCLNFSLTTGHMGDGVPLQMACFFVGADTSSGAIHATISARLQEDGHALRCCGDSRMGA